MTTDQLDLIDNVLRILLNEPLDAGHFDLAIKYPEFNDVFILLADLWLEAESN